MRDTRSRKGGPKKPETLTCVDAHHTHFHGLGNPPAALDVPAEEVARQADLAGVGHGENFLLRFKGEQCRHGPKGLLPRDEHLGRRVQQHGEGVKVAAPSTLPAGIGVGCHPVPAQGDLRALGFCIPHVAVHLVHGTGVDQRAVGRRWIEPGTKLVPSDALDEFLAKRREDPPLHVDAVRADAGLARRAELAHQCTLDRRIKVRVVEHDERRVPAKFHGQLLQRVGRLLHQELADGGRAREGDLLDLGVRAERVADRRSVFERRDDVEHARRDARPPGQFREGERRQGRLARGLDHHGAPCCNGGGGLARDHRRGEVPRRDQPTDPDGFFDGQDPLPAHAGRDGATVDARGFFREPEEEVGRVLDLPSSVCQGFSVLHRYQDGKVFGIVEHELVPLS